MKSLAGFGVVLALSATVPAQQPLQTRFVLASVADQAGSPVLGLAPADFVIEEDGVRRDALDVRPATYPIAIMLDTSSTARQNFMLMRKAVAAFADRFADRLMSLTTFGDVPSRIVSFTDEKKKTVAYEAERLFARPETQSYVMDGLIQVARDLQKLSTPLTQIVVVSAGGVDQSRRAPIDVLRPMFAAHARVHVFETRSPLGSGYLRRPRLRLDSSNATNDATLGLEEFMRALAARTGGHYELVFSGGGFDGALQGLASQLAAEVVVEYIVPDGAAPAKNLKIGVGIPGATVHGLGLEAPLTQ